ncbi:MAG: outer membrane beta-barrel protein [Bacteroidota bacterium]
MKNIGILIAFLLASHALTAQQKDSTRQKFDTLNNKLKNVVVTAQKQYIERQLDKIVLNVQNDITAAGSSLFEIIQKAPGVSITNDESINMSGKTGVNVLIDGKPTQMGQRDLANFLKNTPGNMVDKVEIISNPGSKYDAQGNAGIINIRLKKNKLQGTNGSLSAGYTQQVHYRSNMGINLNHRQGKINAFGSYTYGNNLQHTKGTLMRHIIGGNSTKVFDNNTVDIDPYRSHNFRGGVDLYINKKSTFGFLATGSVGNNPFKTIGVTNIQTNGITDSSLQTNNENFNDARRMNYSANYRFEDTLGNELNIDASYSSFKNRIEQQVSTDYLNKQSQKYNYGANRLQTVTGIHIYSVKADYTKELKKQQAKVETGIKYNRVQTNNDLAASKWTNNIFTADTGRSNDFYYTENILAAYVSYGKKTKKIEYQLGLRAERSVIKGISTDLVQHRISHPDTSYFNIFPTAFLRYTINDKNNVGFSYGRRINRPNYQDLNPFESIIDAYTTEKGNPYLRSSYAHTLELTYTYHDALSFVFGYSHTKDYSQTITEQTGEKAYSQPQNLGVQNTVYLNISLPMPVNDWWYSYTYISGFYNQFKGKLPDGAINNGSLGFTWYLNNSFSLGNGYKAQLSSWGNGATKDALFKTRALGSLDIGFSKTIFKEKGSLKLTVVDIFNTQRWRQSVAYANQNFSLDRKWESQGLRLQFTWKFGKQDFKARERNSASDDANGRIKEKKN